MRVLLDTTVAGRAPRSGTGVYITQVAQALAGLDGVEILSAADHRRRSPAGGGWGSARNLLSDLRHAAVELPRQAREAGAALIHHPLPALAPRCPVPQVITVHDLAFERMPECFDPGYRRYAHVAHRAAARHAAAVICVSESTAADVCGLWGVPAERVVIARHGPGQLPPGAGARPPGRAGPGHFLYVGDSEPRKNLNGLLTAYAMYRAGAEAPLGLVIAGSADARAPGVLVVADPGTFELRELYAGSVALVHPSRLEGFGLTVLEAMALGVPVLCAPSPGLLELGAGAVLYADPRAPAQFAASLTRLHREPALRAELTRLGTERARTFSWEASARAHAEAYSLALAT